MLLLGIHAAVHRCAKSVLPNQETGVTMTDTLACPSQSSCKRLGSADLPKHRPFPYSLHGSPSPFRPRASCQKNPDSSPRYTTLTQILDLVGFKWHWCITEENQNKSLVTSLLNSAQLLPSSFSPIPTLCPPPAQCLKWSEEPKCQHILMLQ